jgi:hypothetical protein
LLFAVVAAPTLAFAQTADQAAEMRLTFGPLALQPRIAIDNLGIDTNVLNSADRPTRDFTVAFLPGVNSRLRIGRTQLRGMTTVELIHFQKARGQRSAAFSQEGRFDAPFGPFTAFLSGGRKASHQRPNIEIDERVGQTIESVAVGGEILIGARARLTVTNDRRRMRFGQGSAVEAGIANALDRRSVLTTTAFSMELTPLTTFTSRVELGQDRFTSSSLRDSDSTAVVGGFRFKPFALISGTAEVGVRSFRSVSRRLPDFDGIVANVQAAYLWRDTARVGVELGRNVDYSINDEEPYFVSTSGALKLTQALGHRWDAVAQAAKHVATYRARLDAGLLDETGSRRDRQMQYTAGLGFRVNPYTRIGFDVVYSRRLSTVAARRYDGFRFGGSFAYAY